MSTDNLLHMKMNDKGMSKKVLSEKVGASERTISKYINGTTVSGPYLTQILETLDITVEEWNQCINVTNSKERRMYEWENIKR